MENLRNFWHAWLWAHFQAKIGQEKKCEDALQNLRGKNADISQEKSEIRVSFELQQ